jgi:glucuronokinase
VSGDVLFHPKKFDLGLVLHYFQTHRDAGDVACYYEMGVDERQSDRGMVEIDVKTNRITRFVEKPAPGVTASHLASLVFCCFAGSTAVLLRQFLAAHPQPADRAFGVYLSWLLPQRVLFGMKLPDRFSLIGNIGLAEFVFFMEGFLGAVIYCLFLVHSRYNQSLVADAVQPMTGMGAGAEKLKALPIVRR